MRGSESGSESGSERWRRGPGVVVWEAQGLTYCLDYHQMDWVTGTLVNEPHTGTRSTSGNLRAGASVKLISGVSTN